MKIRFVYFFLVLPGLALVGQTVKTPGFITLQNSSGRSAFPLEITVSGGATIAKSDPASGYFEVSSPAGGEYFLQIGKAGFAVVNPRALQLFFTDKKANVDTLRIVLNREGAWLDLADRYYRASMGIVTREYERLLADLRKNATDTTRMNAGYRQSLNDLAVRANAALTDVTDIAEHIAQTDADRCPPAYRSALRFLSEGKPAEALGALTQAKTSDELALRARLHVLTLAEAKARADYEAACRIAASDFQLAREYIRYLMLFPEQLDRARAFWENALPLARHENDRATALHGIGAVAISKGDTKEALSLFEQAVQIRERLALTNSFFGPDFAFTSRVLANIYTRSGNAAAARSYYEKADAVWARTPDACSFSFCTEPAVVTGILAGLGNQPALIEQGFVAAAASYERLAGHYTSYGFLRKAGMLAQIAQLRQNNGNIAGATAAWREMASIFEEQEEEWPFLIENLRREYWLPAALAAQPTAPGGDAGLLAKGIDRLRTAARTAPAFFEIDLAKCLNALGAGEIAAGRTESGLQSVDEAMQLIQPYLAQRAFEAMPAFTMSCGTLSELHYQKKEYQQSIEYCNRSLTALQGCNQCTPLFKNSELAKSYNGSGASWFMLEQPQKALQQFTAARDAQRAVVSLAKNLQTVSPLLAILSRLVFTQVTLAIKSDGAPFKAEAKRTIAEAEELLAQFPGEQALDMFRQQFRDFKNNLSD